MKTILIISPEHWDAHTVSKHHYAMTLARMGATVYFLNPPDSRVGGMQITKSASHPGLFIVSSKKVAPGLRFMPSLIRQSLERKWLKDFERLAGVTVDIIWLFENSRFFDLRFAQDRLKIYHQVDYNQNFNLKQAASTADICLCTTDIIKDQLEKYQMNVHKIHHGLSNPENRSKPSRTQLARLNEGAVSAIYIGNLDMRYLDSNLLLQLAESFRDIRFHFVGGYSENSDLRRQTAGLKNITWWGKVDSSLIPSILETADILLVTYKREHWKDQASPHKLMEYLASGKTVVATYTDEYKDKTHLIEMVDNSADYLNRFQHVVDNLDTLNSEASVQARIDFAAGHTYIEKLKSINHLLRSQGLTTLMDT